MCEYGFCFSVLFLLFLRRLRSNMMSLLMTKVVNDGDCSKLCFILFSLDVKYGSKIDARSGSF